MKSYSKHKVSENPKATTKPKTIAKPTNYSKLKVFKPKTLKHVKFSITNPKGPMKQWVLKSYFCFCFRYALQQG